MEDAEAAGSGVLVLATIHAPSAPGAIQSMRSLGVQSHFLSTALRGCVSQRLVRTFDMNTRVAFDLGAAADADQFEEVRKWLGPNEGRTLYGPGAAESNQMSGYAGRTGVFMAERFMRGDWIALETGAPVLTNAIAALDCRVMEMKSVATHDIYFGEVAAIRLANAEKALVYHARAYKHV